MKVEGIPKFLASLTALVSITAFLLATVYYQVFFLHFPELSAKILSISDYFDKAADLLPYVLLVSVGIIVVELKSVNKFKADKIEYGKFPLWVFILMTIFVSISFIVLGLQLRHSLIITVLLILVFSTGLAMQGSLAKVFKDSNRLIEVVGAFNIGFFGLLWGTFFAVALDIAEIRKKDSAFLDIVKNGKMFSQSSQLYFETSDGQKFESELDNLGQSIGCLLKYNKFCDSPPPK